MIHFAVQNEFHIMKSNKTHICLHVINAAQICMAWYNKIKNILPLFILCDQLFIPC